MNQPQSIHEHPSISLSSSLFLNLPTPPPAPLSLASMSSSISLTLSTLPLPPPPPPPPLLISTSHTLYTPSISSLPLSSFLFHHPLSSYFFPPPQPYTFTRMDPSSLQDLARNHSVGAALWTWIQRYRDSGLFNVIYSELLIGSLSEDTNTV